MNPFAFLRRGHKISSSSLGPVKLSLRRCRDHRDVIRQPFRHREAIIHRDGAHEPVAERAMANWTCDPQATTTTATLTVVTCPLLSLRSCVDKKINIRWLPESSQRSDLYVKDAKSRLTSRKRVGSVIVSPSQLTKRQRISATRNDVSHCCEALEKDAEIATTSPRSLQYALPGLSSHDTQHVLHAMRAIPSELRHLNGNASRSRLQSRCEVRQVLGWRHLLCQEDDDEETARRVVWKSAKALNAVKMRPLARQIWNTSTTKFAGVKKDEEQGKVLYTINHRARVTYSMKRRYGQLSPALDQVWIECFLDDGLQICVARKELRQFGEYHAPQLSVTECQGYLVRPIYTRSVNAHLVGCSLQCLRAVAARDGGVRSVPALKQRMINDLPMLTKRCEQDYLCDLVQRRKCS
ncbi:unnamed protein product [Hyaloperonospora brassicae]|uniref:SOCS box domain-containing protein n=1 Tax=Hyaloperonospora brassicae TaxID=162125 RepID=A0AAV0UJY2_HYABA|nr:unnamed protein product [Hyaloperonospora brassicae]